MMIAYDMKGLKGKVIGSRSEYPPMLYVSGDGLRGTQVNPVREPPLGSILPHIRKVDYVERR